MYRQDYPRKRNFDDSRKKHFGGTALFKAVDYPTRLNFYGVPPTAEVTLDQFEQWAIARLKVLGEIESALFRNKQPAEIRVLLVDVLKKYLPLDTNSSGSKTLGDQRRKDHYSHFILRLAFARSEELRRRFSRAETILFRHRYETDFEVERKEFIAGLGLEWEPVGEEERMGLRDRLAAAGGAGGRKGAGGLEDEYFKVDWEKVSDLVEQRRVFLKAGKAYVPASLQLSMVQAEFTARLDKALALTARALPRLDEDDRLIPVLNHLSQGFAAPEYVPSSAPTLLSGAPLTAASIDSLAPHFPACMQHLHATLRRDKKLKHFGRLQYTLFLKGVGLSVEECLTFWRTGFSNTAEDTFNKEYRYNVRHAYGLEGNRRDYKPKSCQQILLEHPPGSGEAHGCPYRHFAPDNLQMFLRQVMGVGDMETLRGVRTDVDAKGFHMACNRVFEFKHRKELEKERERLGVGAGAATKETLIHPNEFFVRSWEVTHPEAVGAVGRKDARGRVIKSEDTPML